MLFWTKSSSMFRTINSFTFLFQRDLLSPDANMVWCWESRSSRKQKKNWRSKSTNQTSRKSTNQTSREPTNQTSRESTNQTSSRESTNQTSRKSINQTSRKSINQTNRESKRYLNRWFDICIRESEIYAEVKGLELLIIWSDHLNYFHKIYAFPVKLFLKLPLFLHSS